MHNLSKMNQEQKMQLLSSIEKHFKTFFLYSLYPDTITSSQDSQISVKIEQAIKALNGGLFDKNAIKENTTFAYQKYPQLFERSEIKQWAVSVCDSLGMSLCNVEDIDRFDANSRVLFAEMNSSHIDDYYLGSVFSPALKRCKYGFVFLNNPDLYQWNEKKVGTFKSFLNDCAQSHKNKAWPVISLQTNLNPNLLFNSYLNTYLVDDSHFIVKKEEKKGWLSKIFSSAESSAPEFFRIKERKEINTIFDLLDCVAQSKKHSSVLLDSQMQICFSRIETALQVISNRLGENIQQTNIMFFNDCKSLLTKDINQIINDYSKVPKEFAELKNNSGESARDLALQSLTNIADFIDAAAQSLVKKDLNGLKTYAVYTRTKLADSGNTSLSSSNYTQPQSPSEPTAVDLLKAPTLTPNHDNTSSSQINIFTSPPAPDTNEAQDVSEAKSQQQKTGDIKSKRKSVDIFSLSKPKA